MKKIELLAPAGNMETLKVAINAGCDAIYLAGKHFGARAFAQNFTDDEIIEAIKYAHLFGVKIYVTINTLVYDSEVEDLIDYVRFLHKNNVDAILMQDIGMIDLVKKTFPNLNIHASTQLHIHNLDGVKLCEELGLERVVLARETPIDKIKEIKNNTNIELEVFVHGALCMSYSGQCLMSYFNGGRSGNRGSCAQCCRLEYDLYSDNTKVSTDKFLLSTRDLCTVERIGELIDSGVSSLKIEGRMKRKEYVYLVVSIYRKAIDSYYKTGHVDITCDDIDELKKIFNREFTYGYLFNEEYIVNSTRPNHIGIEVGKVISNNHHSVQIKLSKSVSRGDGIRILSKIDSGLTLVNFYSNNKQVLEAHNNDIIKVNIECDANIGDIVVKTTDIKQIDGVNKNILIDRKVDIDASITLKLDNPIVLTLTDNYNQVTVKYGKVEKSINNPVTEETIKKQISKFGSTIYKLNNIDITMDNNIFVNIKDLNEIRRLACIELDKKRLHNYEFKEEKYTIDVPDFKKESNKNVKIYSEEDYKYYQGKVNNMYTDEIELYNAHPDIIYITDRVIDKYSSIDNVMLGEFGGLKKYKNFMTDAFFNVTNSYTVAFLHSMGAKLVTLSYEMSYDKVENLVDCYKNRYHKLPNLEVVVYGRLEAMIIKYNILNKYKVEKGYLKDSHKHIFPLRRKNNNIIIYNYETRDLTENYLLLVNNIRYDLYMEKGKYF